MKENVGSLDRIARSIIGPLLIMKGYSRLGGKRGGFFGLLSMIAGAAVVESAITRVCPMNKALGVDTRSAKQAFEDNIEVLEKATRQIEALASTGSVEEVFVEIAPDRKTT